MFNLIVIVCAFIVADGAKILAVWPVPSVSHQVVFRPLTQELAKRGHDVTIITPDPAFEKGNSPPNIKEIDVHDISYEIWTQFFETSTGTKNDLATQLRTSVNLLREIVLKQLKVDEVKLLLNESFDLLLIEACVRPALVFSHIFKVPVIQVSSFGGFYDNYERMGAPIHPLVYPSNTRQRIYNLTMMEKATEMYNYFALDGTFQKQEEAENIALRKLFSDMPTLSELTTNVDLMFLNVHPIWDGNRPVPPSIVYIGGIYQKPKKDLPEDLATYLNSSNNGVVYVSFGTNVSPSTLPPEKINKLTNVLSQLDYDVLWKWDKDELPGRTGNIRIFKWLPQSDLLRHPKIKLFITQAGLQSTDEAISAGVPLLGIPMLGDQWYNAEKYVQLNIGAKVSMDNLEEDELRTSIYKILNDESYRRNIVRLRSLMHDQPQSGLERAVWWTEHVLRHGGARHLRAPAASMTWAEYLQIDLVLIVLFITLSLALSVIGGIFYLVQFLRVFRYRKIKQS